MGRVMAMGVWVSEWHGRQEAIQAEPPFMTPYSTGIGRNLYRFCSPASQMCPVEHIKVPVGALNKPALCITHSKKTFSERVYFFRAR
jgi:hypothetical protein